MRTLSLLVEIDSGATPLPDILHMIPKFLHIQGFRDFFCSMLPPERAAFSLQNIL